MVRVKGVSKQVNPTTVDANDQRQIVNQNPKLTFKLKSTSQHWTEQAAWRSRTCQAMLTAWYQHQLISIFSTMHPNSARPTSQEDGNS
jgi:hypothetical protein